MLCLCNVKCLVHIVCMKYYFHLRRTNEYINYMPLLLNVKLRKFVLWAWKLFQNYPMPILRQIIYYVYIYTFFIHIGMY